MPIHNVRFGDIDSYKDLGLILSSRDISAPEVKDNYVDIDGADGSIDLTEVFGRIFYNDRDISLTFAVLPPVERFWEVFSRCQNLLHGRKFKIVFDDDEDWYYVGRVSIDKWRTDKVVGSMTFDITCEPWKYWREPTVIKENVNGQKVIRLDNGNRPVNPTFHTSTSMSLVFGDKTVISPINEDFYSADILLKEGTNWLTVNGTGQITITYQIGSL